MASLKEVRNRIVSVNSTQQITKAMKMVSAAKLRRAQDAIHQMRPYAQKLAEMIATVSAQTEAGAENPFTEVREIKNALIIGAETLTRLTDWSDRNTCVLFGDAAGAVVLSVSDTNNIKDIICGSISDDQGYLICKNGDLKVPEINAISEQDHIHMNGREVFKFATRIMPKMINDLLDRNDYNKEDVNYVVAHQANQRIIDKASRDVGIGMDKMFLNIHKYGNTSAASVPLALDEAIKEGKLKKGDLFITVAFGGGFSYGGALIEL